MVILTTPKSRGKGQDMSENIEIPYSLPTGEYDAQAESRMRDYLAELLRRGDKLREREEKEAA